MRGKMRREMKNKKGYIRILEAGLAAILLLGFIFVVSMPNYVKKTSLEDEIYKSITSALDEIGRDSTLRGYVLVDNEAELTSFAMQRLGERNLEGAVAVCGLQEFCRPPSGLPEKDVFVRERVVTDGAQNVKKVALYVWTKF